MSTRNPADNLIQVNVQMSRFELTQVEDCGESNRKFRREQQRFALSWSVA